EVREIEKENVATVGSTNNILFENLSRRNANREHQEFNIETDLVNLILNDIIHTVFEKVRDKHNERSESNEQSNNNLNGKKIIVHSNMKINNLWSQHFHWPKVEKTNTKRKSNSQMPFATTSKKWKEYTDAIKTEKKEKEVQKLQRKTNREKKQVENGEKEKGKSLHRSAFYCLFFMSDNGSCFLASDFIVLVGLHTYVFRIALINTSPGGSDLLELIISLRTYIEWWSAAQVKWRLANVDASKHSSFQEPDSNNQTTPSYSYNSFQSPYLNHSIDGYRHQQYSENTYSTFYSDKHTHAPQQTNIEGHSLNLDATSLANEHTNDDSIISQALRFI
ncbi:hypothetical protein FQA39_LY09514, partial [Lamprigera yunnana]